MAFDFLKKWTSSLADSAVSSSGSISENNGALKVIVDKLNNLGNENDAEYVAQFAFILARVAYADMEVSDSEEKKIREILQDVGKMNSISANLIAELVQNQSHLFGNTENYSVTRDFGLSATKEQKMSLLRCLFAVSAADESITTEEEKELKLITSELKLSEYDYVDIRSEYRQYREVLKGLPE